MAEDTTKSISDYFPMQKITYFPREVVGFLSRLIVNELRLLFVTIVTESAFFVTIIVTGSDTISKNLH
jgi:hypothetical protein